MAEALEEKKKEVFLRRVFRHQGGDWDKTEKLTREIMATAQEMEAFATKLMAADAKLKKLQLQAYETAPIVDALYMDSPISPGKQVRFLELQFRKLGWDGIRDVHVDPALLEPFTKHVKLACKWLLKFKDDKNI